MRRNRQIALQQSGVEHQVRRRNTGRTSTVPTPSWKCRGQQRHSPAPAGWSWPPVTAMTPAGFSTAAMRAGTCPIAVPDGKRRDSRSASICARSSSDHASRVTSKAIPWCVPPDCSPWRAAGQLMKHEILQTQEAAGRSENLWIVRPQPHQFVDSIHRVSGIPVIERPARGRNVPPTSACSGGAVDCGDKATAGVQPYPRAPPTRHGSPHRARSGIAAAGCCNLADDLRLPARPLWGPGLHPAGLWLVQPVLAIGLAANVAPSRLNATSAAADADIQPEQTLTTSPQVLSVPNWRSQAAPDRTPSAATASSQTSRRRVRPTPSPWGPSVPWQWVDVGRVEARIAQQPFSLPGAQGWLRQHVAQVVENMPCDRLSAQSFEDRPDVELNDTVSSQARQVGVRKAGRTVQHLD